MDSSLTDIEFLVRSPYRVAVLDALTAGPRNRDELRELTDASSPTLGRILSSFERRDWIVRTGQEYELLALGSFVAEGVLDLLARMETARKLRDVVRWLPTDTLGFDLDCLTDATVTLPSRSDPLAPMRRANELERTARRSRVLTHALPSPCLDAHWEAISTGVHRFDAVLTPGVVATMAQPAHAPQFADVLCSQQSTVFVCDEDVPTVVGINDGVVYVGVDDRNGAPIALIETDDETVRSWAEDTFESYRRTSSLLTLDRFMRMGEVTRDSSRMEELSDVPSIRSNSSVRQ